MSFKLFIYYGAICGGWAALVGWALGQALTAPLPGDWGEETRSFARALLQGLALGASVAFALGWVDALWGLGGRPSKQAAVKGLVVALIGCACGLLGAAVGQSVFWLTHWEVLTVFGWTLTGLLIGASIGAYDLLSRRRGRGGVDAGTLRKVRNGCLGGLIGGASGGVLHLVLGHGLPAVLSALGHLAPGGFRSTSAWGFVALGVCIGLFIGLAQVLLTEAWVRVEAGFRAGREMFLTRDEVTIGRAEACDVGLFGDAEVERTHARIRREDHRYVLLDADTPGGTYVNDRRIGQPTPLCGGDLIRVGRSLLRFGERQKRN